jgi:hypothetical protein
MRAHAGEYAALIGAISDDAAAAGAAAAGGGGGGGAASAAAAAAGAANGTSAAPHPTATKPDTATRLPPVAGATPADDGGGGSEATEALQPSARAAVSDASDAATDARRPAAAESAPQAAGDATGTRVTKCFARYARRMARPRTWGDEVTPRKRGGVWGRGRFRSFLGSSVVAAKSIQRSPTAAARGSQDAALSHAGV